MRALLTAVGTRGDVQPALELRERGRAVRLCVSPSFVAQATGLGFEAVPMGVEMRMPAGSSSPPTLTSEELQRLRESMPDLITDQFETVGAAARECDVILGANAHQYAAPSIAEHLGIGCVTAVYAPVPIPSTDLSPPPPPGGNFTRVPRSASFTPCPTLEPHIYNKAPRKTPRGSPILPKQFE